jgi:putative transcriptional regulator
LVESLEGEPNAMSDDGITRVKRDPANRPKPGLSRFNAMSEDERHAAALADPDALPANEAELATARRGPNVRAIREQFGLSVEDFGRRFGLSPVLLRQWEEGTRWPDRAAKMLLRVIEREPEAVARVAAE